MQGPVIDADGHVFEPLDLWERELPSQYRDTCVHVIEKDGREHLALGEHILVTDISPADFATPKGFAAGGPLGRPLSAIPAASWEPKARVALLDEQGIDVTYLYPTMLLNLDMYPDGLRQAMNTVYDEWIADFCATDPARLKWVAPISRNDLDHAIAEVGRAVDLGCSGVFLSPVPTYAGTLLGDPAEDRLIAAIAETGLPLAVHASDPWNSTLAWQPLLPTRWAWDVGSATLEMQFAMIWVFSNGLLDRFPSLKVAFLEGNVGWFPWLIQKMAASYEHLAALHPAPAQTPLETFRQRCWISGETEEPMMGEVVRLIGADRVLWASDFPHYECSWDPIDELEEAEGLTDAEKRAIVTTGPASFYGFELASVPVRA